MNEMWKPLRCFLQTMEAVSQEVDINEIRIKLNIHKEGDIYKCYKKYIDYPIVVLRDSQTAELILLANWGTFIMRKLLGKKTVKVFILDESYPRKITGSHYVEVVRSMFFKKLECTIKNGGYFDCNVSLMSIRVPKEFEQTTPNSLKIDKARKYYHKNKELDLSPIIKPDGYLVDGYVRYLIAKENNVMEIPVRIKLW